MTGTRLLFRRAAIVALATGLMLSAAIATAAAADAKKRSFAGMCAFYSEKERVASGGHFDPTAMTAAHRTLPFGTRVRVTDPKTGHSVIVTVNDRGPFNKGRVIDISLAAARALGMTQRGVIYVRAEVL